MYDTIFFHLTQEQAGGIDFLAETPCFLTNVGEHYFRGNDEPKLTGYLDNLKVCLSSYSMSIKGGSLSKYSLGDNYQTLSRKSTQTAIEKVSDCLHLPIDKARVTRLDVGTTFILNNPVDVYLSHLGALSYSKRLVEPDGLYYAQKERRLCFYDKNKEQRREGEQIPELYRGKNVLRYEHRLTGRIPSKLGVPEVTGAMLYNKDFFKCVVDEWRSSYIDIKKINDRVVNAYFMKSVKDFKRAGLLSLIESAGGFNAMLQQIDVARKKGEISPKQAHDLRLAMAEANSTKEGLIVPNSDIAELNQKVDEAVKYYT